MASSDEPVRTGMQQDAGEATAAAVKRTLRHAAYPPRRARDAAARLAAGEACARRLCATQPARDAQCVACYVSMGTEVDTMPMLHMLLDAGRRVLVPRLGSGMQLGWSALGDAADLGLLRAVDDGHLRPDEPELPVLGPDALADCGLVVLPALAVDHAGTRLGRGGGWYDRALAWRRPDAPLVALVWDWEFTDGVLPREAHDVPVDAVLTPDRLVAVGHRGVWVAAGGPGRGCVPRRAGEGS